MKVNHQSLLVGMLIVVKLVLIASVEMPETRIIGGEQVDKNIPYIVSLVANGIHFCGGSIINNRTVITAAHCFQIVVASQMQVHAGTNSLSLDEGILVNVTAVHANKKYTNVTHDYDIALVRLTEPLNFTSNISPIRLAARDDAPPHDRAIATVAGWGTHNADLDQISNNLFYAKVPIVNQDTCRSLVHIPVTKRMICAGYKAGGVDACINDSGGPLVVQKTLVGIVSWGESCAKPNSSGVYARVSELRPWVDNIMAQKYNETL